MAKPELYVGGIEYDFNGLVTGPRSVRRSLFRMFGRVHVPPGTCALLTGNQGYEAALAPGNHTHLSLPTGPLVLQYVNMTVQNRPVEKVSALSRDKWEVTLEGMLTFQVSDPFKAANAAKLLETLDHAARATVLSLIEEFEHDALTGRVDEAGEESLNSGIPALCREVVARLKTDSSLASLQLVSFHVTSRKGDERRIKIAQESSVEQTRVLEESRVKRLQHQATLLETGAELELKQQALKIRQLELAQEREEAQNSELIRLIQSETDAKAAFMMREEKEWQTIQKRQEEEWRIAREFDMLQLKSRHEEALEAIRGTTIISTEAAAAGNLNNLNLSTRRRAELVGDNNGGGDVISQGLQALKDLPGASNSYGFFLPNRLQAGNRNGNTGEIEKKEAEKKEDTNGGESEPAS
jgi:hypothetical protein